MEVNSIEKLREFLISCAFQRCRVLDDFCRLSVSLKPTPPLVLMSVSDTGSRSTLDEFQELKYQNDCGFAGKWDGVLCIATTGISEKEIHHLKFVSKEAVSSRRLIRLPSATKNGAKFSGTEVSLSTYEDIDCLVTTISHFLRKMLLLKVPKIAVELMVESGGTKSIVLQKACSAPAMDAANIDHLRSGLEDYVSKHENRLVKPCHSCFSTGKNLKVGMGIACSRENQPNLTEMMEVVIIISDTSMSDQGSCSRLYGRRTEVLYFQDFLPCPISKPSLEALTSFEWKNYGLALKSVGDQDGVTLLEWENLPPFVHIDISLHRYHKQVMILPRAQSNTIDRSLTRKAVKLALTDLKKKNEGLLLSARAVKPKMEECARRRLALLASHVNPPAETSPPSSLSASACASSLDGNGDNDCVFCKIIRGEAPALKLYEDDECLCILDTYPLCHGHALIIPKSHFPSLDATPPSIIGSMCSKVPLISNAVMKVTGCDSFNVLVNNGAAAGQVIYHTHIHIIPRKAHDWLWTSESIRRRPLKLDEEAAQLADRVRESLTFTNSYEDSKGQGSSSSLVVN